MEMPDWLVLTVWRALLGELYPCIRAVAVSLSEDRVLVIRYYLDREPSEFDWESLEVVATNIAASTGRNRVERVELDCKFEPGSIGSLDPLNGFIYCRREYEMPRKIQDQVSLHPN